jgi:hypothetical protein
LEEPEPVDIKEYMKKLQDLQSLATFHQNETVFANLGGALQAAYATLRVEGNATMVQKDISSFFLSINKSQNDTEGTVADLNQLNTGAVDNSDVVMN